MPAPLPMKDSLQNIQVVVRKCGHARLGNDGKQSPIRSTEAKLDVAMLNAPNLESDSWMARETTFGSY